MNPETVPLSPARITAAFAVAVGADILQLPLTAMSLTGFLTVPAELFDLLLDGVVCIVLSVLLGGFHWLLIPAFLVEAIPFVDALPTWTATVGALVLLRKQEASRAKAATTVVPAMEIRPAQPRDAEVIVPDAVSLVARKETAS